VIALEAAIVTGLRCFPCHWRNKAPAMAGPAGYKYTTVDRDARRQLWRRYPGRFVGVATSKVSGLNLLDLRAVRKLAQRGQAP
jgi:hypothetical protein